MLSLEFLVIQCSNQISKVKSRTRKFHYFEPVEGPNIASKRGCVVLMVIWPAFRMGSVIAWKSKNPITSL